jgi:hypothetical protein
MEWWYTSSFNATSLCFAGRNDAYEAALAALREDTRQWWEDQLTEGPKALDEDREPYNADTAGLCGFLEGEILPRLAARWKELSNRPLIRRTRHRRRDARSRSPATDVPRINFLAC